MLELSNAVSYQQDRGMPNQNADLTKLYDSQPYTAYTEDLEFMWRWTIYQDNKLVQEGCSLTLEASRRAVQHVLAFFSMNGRDKKAEQEL